MRHLEVEEGSGKLLARAWKQGWKLGGMPVWALLAVEVALVEVEVEVALVELPALHPLQASRSHLALTLHGQQFVDRWAGRLLK